MRRERRLSGVIPKCSKKGYYRKNVSSFLENGFSRN